jgi:hypothetical protein
VLTTEELNLEDARIQAVRQAVWDAWSDDEWAFSRLHDVLVDTVMEHAPSREQLKAVFMMLPAFLIGKGIAWGFNDTEVGDGMFRFVEENEPAVRACLTSVPG